MSKTSQRPENRLQLDSVQRGHAQSEPFDIGGHLHLGFLGRVLLNPGRGAVPEQAAVRDNN
jgi:hypothetical protein